LLSPLRLRISEPGVEVVLDVGCRGGLLHAVGVIHAERE
jgi:hypothetical protein